MRPFMRLAMLAFSVSAATTAIAAVGPPTELTPQNMDGAGFSIVCRFRDETIKEGDKPTRPTGVVLVQVIFDAEKGPRIKDLDSAALVVKHGGQSMWIPVQWSAGPHPGFIQFSIPETMIANASIVLSKTEQNPTEFAVVLQKFRQ